MAFQISHSVVPRKDSDVTETAECRKDNFIVHVFKECYIKPLYHACTKVACLPLVQCFTFNLPSLCTLVLGDHFVFSALAGIKTQEKKNVQVVSGIEVGR